MLVINILTLFNETLNISLYAARNEVMVWIGMNGCEGRRREREREVERERVTRTLLRESEAKQVNY